MPHICAASLKHEVCKHFSFTFTLCKLAKITRLIHYFHSRIEYWRLIKTFSIFTLNENVSKIQWFFWNVHVEATTGPLGRAQVACWASPPDGLINSYFSPTSSQPNNAWLNEVIIFTGDITHRKIAGISLPTIWSCLLSAGQSEGDDLPRSSTELWLNSSSGRLFDQADTHLRL